MSRFDYLKQYDVREGKTSEYTLFSIRGEPTLTVLYAGERNKPFFNAVLKKTKTVSAARRKLSAARMKKDRQSDKELYAKYIIKGWRNVLERNDRGEEVESTFSPENVLEWLEALPNHMFDEIRMFCSDETNFIEEVELGEEPNGVDIAGN